MRQLTARQEKALKKLYEEFGLVNVDDTIGLSPENLRTVNDIYDMGPHETFYQNANRYIWDLHWERELT